ncbi:MAG: alpha/beta fold hydrolase [bacterium]|nr:alpha/beta fold hydrolase [bacterium]
MKLAYREFGNGPPLLILHGLFGQSDNWNTLAKQFALQGFRVFTPDQRNHGLSPHDPIWNYKVMAEDLYEFINEHQLNGPIIMGHSMGGKTVLFFEHLHPGIASKLILVDIAARAYEPQHDQVLEALNAVNFNTISSRKEAEAVLNSYLSDFGTKQFLLKNIYWEDEANKRLNWRFDLNTITTYYNNIGVEAPNYVSATKTLVLRGEKSPYVSEVDLQNYRSRFSQVSFETIVGAGHWVHAEKPKEFFEAVLKFIKD